MPEYKIRNMSFSVEEPEYLRKGFYFSHIPVQGFIKIDKNKKLSGRIEFDIPIVNDVYHSDQIRAFIIESIECRFYESDLLKSFIDKMVQFGGFNTSEYSSINNGSMVARLPFKEIHLDAWQYKLDEFHNPIIYFTERQLSGNLAMFKLHATKIEQI